jgi:hypothetical protein
MNRRTIMKESNEDGLDINYKKAGHRHSKNVATNSIKTMAKFKVLRKTKNFQIIAKIHEDNCFYRVPSNIKHRQS